MLLLLRLLLLFMLCRRPQPRLVFRIGYEGEADKAAGINRMNMLLLLLLLIDSSTGRKRS
jgi:hypothetical protein